MVILGIDPGTTQIGFGLIKKEGAEIQLKKYGCLFFNKYKPEERVLHIFNQIFSLLTKEKPDIVAIEKVFFGKNAKTAMAVSEARGVIILSVLKKGLPFEEYTPLQVKQATTSYGRAGKKEMQKMVRLLLDLKEDPKPDDAADALAIAITCAQYINPIRNKAS